MFQENLPNNPIVASPIDFPKIVFLLILKTEKQFIAWSLILNMNDMEQNICTKSEASRGEMNF